MAKSTLIPRARCCCCCYCLPTFQPLYTILSFLNLSRRPLSVAVVCPLVRSVATLYLELLLFALNCHLSLHFSLRLLHEQMGRRNFRGVSASKCLRKNCPAPS